MASTSGSSSSDEESTPKTLCVWEPPTKSAKGDDDQVSLDGVSYTNPQKNVDFCVWEPPKKSSKGDDDQVSLDGVIYTNPQKNVDDDDDETTAIVPQSQKQQQQPSSLFSEEDEITLLRGLQKFQRKHGLKNDWVKFHKAILGKLSSDFTKNQVSEKIRREKCKFQRNRKNSLPLYGHKARMFKLAKSLWENDDGDNDMRGNTSINGKRKRVAFVLSGANANDEEKNSKKATNYVSEGEHLDPTEYPLLNSFFNNLLLPEYLKKQWTLIGSENAEKLEKRWEPLFQKELELNLEILNFKDEVCRLILDQMKRT